MKVDIQRLYTEGHSYLMSVIDQLKEEDWQELVNAKLSSVTNPEELELMKTLWSHGYAKGAAASLTFVTNLKT